MMLPRDSLTHRVEHMTQMVYSRLTHSDG